MVHKNTVVANMWIIPGVDTKMRVCQSYTRGQLLMLLFLAYLCAANSLSTANIVYRPSSC